MANVIIILNPDGRTRETVVVCSVGTMRNSPNVGIGKNGYTPLAIN